MLNSLFKRFSINFDLISNGVIRIMIWFIGCLFGLSRLQGIIKVLSELFGQRVYQLFELGKGAPIVKMGDLRPAAL